MAPVDGARRGAHGNPVAPLMNRLLPNPHFHIATDQELTDLRSLAMWLHWKCPGAAFGDHLIGTRSAALARPSDARAPARG
jgi:hypothetical protein